MNNNNNKPKNILIKTRKSTSPFNNTLSDPMNSLQNTYLKDISKLGRDLNKVIIIDNACGNFQLQSDNGIFVQTWIGDKDDDILFKLIPVLKEIVIKKIPDVRKALRNVRDTMIRFYVHGDIYPYSTVVQYITGEKKVTE